MPQLARNTKACAEPQAVEACTPSADTRRLLSRSIQYVAGLDYERLGEVPVPLETDHTLILDVPTETQLFEQMNLAYYRAAQVRGELSPLPGEQELSELRYWLTRADAIRNHLLVTFHKLTVSIAKRFVGPRHRLPELVSEGNATLLRAITLFDPSRGFRFSTYATHAVRRRLGRYVNSAEHQYLLPVDFRETEPVADQRRWTLSYQRAVTTGVDWLESAVYQLSHRERYILRCRFGWGREFEPRTLQEIAEELGVSRERVRQLEARAIRKLQDSAAAADLPML